MRLVRVVALMAATALMGSAVLVVVSRTTEWRTNGWVWLLVMAGLTVISGGVSWWSIDDRSPIPADGEGVASARIETVHPHEGSATRAGAAVVMAITAESEPSPGGLVGRDQELVTLLTMLDRRPGAAAGVVVSGMAGVGKTALAWQAARTAVGRGWFPGGALVVDLHGDDADRTAQVALERVYAALLRALDPSLPVADLPGTVEEQASAYHQLMAHLDRLSRPVLLVLDNVGDIDQVTGLLPAGRAHRVLITSRHTLGELPGARLLEVDVLGPEHAVELLGARRPGDSRLGADPAAAAELARLCGHLPVALQTIAVLVADDPARPIAGLVKELAEQTTRLPGSPSQRWAGRAALTLSYGHLEDTPARLFRLLTMVPGGDVSAPAAAALADQPVDQVRASVAALTRAHLLECHRPVRWRMHDLVRLCATEFATAHAQHDGQDQAIARLLGHYRDTTHAATRRLSAVPTQPMSNSFDTAAHALDWLSAERANLVAAVTWAAGTPGRCEHAIDIALGLAQFLDRERYLEDWTVTATTAVHAATGLGDHHREGAALNNLGSALAEVGRFEEAITSYRQAADIYHKLGDQHGEGRAQGNLGLALIQLRRPGDARAALEQASALFVALHAYDDADRVVGLLTTLNDSAGSRRG
ncbi:MAG: tetratricopeptide repeat protein [Pseudonocardiaceae bacterium]